ncbi:hypothetical protein COU59_02265 [Candidatus Pacearchaeota archaeon CG10_big_fil_rev_8_21_14_0_10_34_12]|nr:MAG: hypothetical protein COU59_02265 [Candidatus Pacearchaeota archaeon CG10_big_fil_rev_8_21_14_0_10_34_12]
MPRPKNFSSDEEFLKYCREQIERREKYFAGDILAYLFELNRNLQKAREYSRVILANIEEVPEANEVLQKVPELERKLSELGKKEDRKIIPFRKRRR